MKLTEVTAHVADMHHNMHQSGNVRALELQLVRRCQMSVLRRGPGEPAAGWRDHRTRFTDQRVPAGTVRVRGEASARGLTELPRATPLFLSVPRAKLRFMKVLDDDTPMVPCQCPDCECTNTADLIVGDHNTPICGCCLADCPHVHGPEGRRPEHYRYSAEWSDEKAEFVGLSTEFPSLSFLAPTPHEALAGIKALVADALRDMAQTGKSPPEPDGTRQDDGGATP